MSRIVDNDFIEPVIHKMSEEFKRIQWSVPILFSEYLENNAESWKFYKTS